jgi:hypothetical protein
MAAKAFIQFWGSNMASKIRRYALFGIIPAAALIVATPLDAQRPERQGTADARRFYADDPLWQDDDRRDIPKVEKWNLSPTYDLVENTFGNPARSRGPALNTNTLGEVPDSSWFTNRIGITPMTIDQLVKGPGDIAGPAPGPWTIIGRPGAGITPKFTIRDANGETFVIKLDPPEAPELASSVELIGTKIFHAIGYNVPEDFVASMDPEQLTVAAGTMFKSKFGTKRPLQLDEVKQWLAKQPRQPDGTIRVLASRWVPGSIVGQFRYAGTRPDDANDIYPHERRRELRALKVFAAWLNHDDARSLNTIDTYVNDGGRRYIKHYLQDFGSTLGSGSTAAQKPRAGNEHYIEGGQIAKGLITFGLWQRDWASIDYPDIPSVGNIEADRFEPARWKTEYPNPAFEQMDAADAFWAAGIASRFTDDMIAAIVNEARLSDPRAVDYLTGVIIKRRDKVVAHWLTAINPLDRFETYRNPNGVTLTFDHAAQRLGLAPDNANYRISYATFDNTTGIESAAVPEVATMSREVRVPAAAWGPADGAGYRYAIASIRTVQAGYPNWAQPVRVTLRDRHGRIDVVAIDRASGDTARGETD